MALPIDEELLKDMSVMILNYKVICDHFGLTEAERRSPSAGPWIIDCIKQYQTSYMITKTMKMRAHDNQKIENFVPETQMPPKPLIDSESEPKG